VALHSCDTPECLNPDHLRWGTQVENIAEMKARGRARGPSRPGSLTATSKLREQDIPEIRRLLSEGFSQAEIGRRFGVGQMTISDINRRATWSHV
jgi:DNA invertase Pin-like site-specific DNA recombinase